MRNIQLEEAVAELYEKKVDIVEPTLGNRMTLTWDELSEIKHNYRSCQLRSGSDKSTIVDNVFDVVSIFDGSSLVSITHEELDKIYSYRGYDLTVSNFERYERKVYNKLARVIAQQTSMMRDDRENLMEYLYNRYQSSPNKLLALLEKGISTNSTNNVEVFYNNLLRCDWHDLPYKLNEIDHTTILRSGTCLLINGDNVELLVFEDRS